MGKKAMQQRMKSWGSFCLILLLLPYVVTVFVHGGEFGREDNSGQVIVKVRKGEGNTDSKMRMYGEDGTTVRAVSRFFHFGNNVGEEVDTAEQIVEIPWEEYFIGVMAQEVPPEGESEFLKAQAVLIRTKLYQELDSQGEAEENTGETEASEGNTGGAEASEGNTGGAEASEGNTGGTEAPEGNTGGAGASEGNTGGTGAASEGNTKEASKENSGEAGGSGEQADTEKKEKEEVRGKTAQKGKILEERYLDKEEAERKFGAADYEKYYHQLQKAMQETENQVLFYQDAYAWVPFHQSSNGMTRNAKEVLGQDSYPYLISKECQSDKEAEDEMQISTFEYKEVQTKCQSFLVAVAEKDAEKTYQFSDFEILEYDTAGYVSRLRIGETVCTGDQFRDALSLASSAFSLKDAEGKLRITTTGKGHGLGMSQWTAQKMAKEGKSYEEILQYFFEGTVIMDGGKIQNHYDL